MEIFEADITVVELSDEEFRQVFLCKHPRYIMNPFNMVLYDREKMGDDDDDDLDAVGLGMTI